MEVRFGLLETIYGKAKFVDLKSLDWIHEAPYVIRLLAENVARSLPSDEAERALEALSKWKSGTDLEISFYPSRLISQDLTGVALALDLALLREAVAQRGLDPRVVDPIVEVDLIVDHSLQVDSFGSSLSLGENMRLEALRNRDKFRLLKWAQKAFKNFRVIPPGNGIIHQINVEQLATVVRLEEKRGELWITPDTVLGTDSHTTMVNALGVLGWGVGGLEAEAVMLGEPYYIAVPKVVGVRLYGELRPGVTATDLALYVTELLRKRGVVEAFVEFFGESYNKLSVWTRFPVANMAPEYGATVGFFPIDENTLKYLRITGRDESWIKLIEAYTKRTGLWYDVQNEPNYSEVIELDLSSVEPSIAGPKNPFERISLKEVKTKVKTYLPAQSSSYEAEFDKVKYKIEDGYVALAAIASCTNTGSLDLLVAAGLIAKRAVKRGLQVKPWVKTSFTPGSRLAVRVLEELNLMPYLEALRFHVVGYACATCIGNSGPLVPVVEEAARRGVHLVAVISGNRNFSGRIHPLIKSVYLASPPLVVVYALTGRIDIDLENEPIGLDPNGKPVYLKELWPKEDEVHRELEKLDLKRLSIEVFCYIQEPSEWLKIEAPEGLLYDWKFSVQIVKPPLLFVSEEERTKDIIGARILVLAPDNTNTDHISPAGPIKRDSQAGRYLLELGIDPEAEGLTFGSMRGNHEVMVRGTFDSPGFKNLISEKRGAWTKIWPEGVETTIFEASKTYMSRGVPAVIVAGKNYGMGSSRDWAARAPRLLGVKAVIAESFERIHRRNLVAVGILPLEVEERLIEVLRGDEEIDILGLSEGIAPGSKVKVVIRRSDGSTLELKAKLRLDSWAEVEYYKSGGVLSYVFKKILEKSYGTK
ncbi:MAG: aconitate hydratase AcnA [Acidilobaceae archaeon]